MPQPRQRARRRSDSPLERLRKLDGPRRLASVCVVVIACVVATELPHFGWLDAALLLTAISVLRLMVRSNDQHAARLPFYDGTLLMAAGVWSVILTLFNTLDGGNATVQLMTFCSAVLVWAAGLRLRAMQH